MSNAGTVIPKVDTRHRDKLLMLASTIVRMIVGSLTFIILAKYLGPSQFGVIATAIAYTAFVSLVTDFGFPVSSLRLASSSPELSQKIVWRCLQAKGALSLLATIFGGAVALFVLPENTIPIYGLIFVGSLAYSSADLIMVCARARQRFGTEAKLVLTSSVVMLIVLGGVAYLTKDLLYCAFAFTASRLFYLVISARYLLTFSVIDFDFSDFISNLKASASFALDNVLTALSSQVDLLLFGALLSAHGVGIYQAGARLVQAIIPFAVVLSTVYLPTLTRALAQNDHVAFTRNARQLCIEFTAIAVIGGLGFAFIGPLFTQYVYGPSYEALSSLWGGFAVFVVVRFGAAAYGVVLAAQNRLGMRIGAQLISILTLVAASTILIPRYGLQATSGALALSSAPAFLLLAFGAWRSDRKNRTVITTALVVCAAAGLLLLSKGLVL